MLTIVNQRVPFSVADVPAAQTAAYSYSAPVQVAPLSRRAGVGITSLTFTCASGAADVVMEYAPTAAGPWTAFTVPSSVDNDLDGIAAGTWAFNCLMPGVPGTSWVRVGLKKDAGGGNDLTAISGFWNFVSLADVPQGRIAYNDGLVLSRGANPVIGTGTVYGTMFPIPPGNSGLRLVAVPVFSASTLNVGIDYSDDGSYMYGGAANVISATVPANTVAGGNVTGNVAHLWGRLKVVAAAEPTLASAKVYVQVINPYATE
ncbi:MAG: hypothetical protein IT340_19915 [Chloroflexi bacterium]|nr:hypothetical protein [Chloroflexota bacterium]